MSVITTATGAVSATITVGSNPRGVAITPDGTHVYVTNGGDGTVSVITTATGVVSAPITVGYGPFGVAITPDGTARLRDQQPRWHGVGDHDGDGCGVGPDHGRQAVRTGWRSLLTAQHAYVTNSGDGTVSAITTATGAVSAPITVGKSPYGVAITPDGTARLRDQLR